MLYLLKQKNLWDRHFLPLLSLRLVKFFFFQVTNLKIGEEKKNGGQYLSETLRPPMPFDPDIVLIRIYAKEFIRDMYIFFLYECLLIIINYDNEKST